MWNGSGSVCLWIRWMSKTWTNESQVRLFSLLFGAGIYQDRFMFQVNVHSVNVRHGILQFFGFVASILFSFLLSPYGGRDSLAGFAFWFWCRITCDWCAVTIEIRKNSHHVDVPPELNRIELNWKHGLFEWIIWQKCLRSPLMMVRFARPSSLLSRTVHTETSNEKGNDSLSRKRVLPTATALSPRLHSVSDSIQ